MRKLRGLVLCLGLSIVLNAETVQIVSVVPGTTSGTIGVGTPLVVGWVQPANDDVVILAHLDNGNSIPSTGTAFLTTMIGPGTFAGPPDEIAQTTFTLNGPFTDYGFVPLFSGLSLRSGTYWLTISESLNPTVNEVNWDICNPCSITAGGGANFIGWGHTSATFNDVYPPASTFLFLPSGFPLNPEFEVFFVPEPSAFDLAGLGIFLFTLTFAYRRRFTSASIAYPKFH